MSSKRGSYKSLELSKKFEILQRLRKGESAVKLSQEFGIPRTSVNDIKKNADKIEEFISTMEVTDGNVTTRKRMKTAENSELDEAVYVWFTQRRSQGLRRPINY